MPKKIRKDKVALVGMSRAGRTSIPFNDDSYEIWGLNRAYALKWMTRWDRWFEIHPLSVIVHNWGIPKQHLEWLKNATGFPIYMQHKHKIIPSSKRYPLEKVVDRFGPEYDSTVAYMLALAALEGFKRIEIYGFSMTSNTEYFTQLPNFRYLMGRIRESGVDVWVHPDSLIEKGHDLYAYGDLDSPRRQQIERLSRIYVKELENAKKGMHYALGAQQIMEVLAKNITGLPEHEYFQKAIRDVEGNVQQFLQLANNIMGIQTGIAEVKKALGLIVLREDDLEDGEEELRKLDEEGANARQG